MWCDSAASFRHVQGAAGLPAVHQALSQRLQLAGRRRQGLPEGLEAAGRRPAAAHRQRDEAGSEGGEARQEELVGVPQLGGDEDSALLWRHHHVQGTRSRSLSLFWVMSLCVEDTGGQFVRMKSLSLFWVLDIMCGRHGCLVRLKDVSHCSGFGTSCVEDTGV